MKRILFMPFLQLSSGHHQVANGIIDSLHETKNTVECEKVDILSYSYGHIEIFVSRFYIQWIHLLPNLYSWIYKRSAYTNKSKEKRFYFYEWLFLNWMEQLIKEKKPNLIICTHSFPSYLLSHLKRKGKISIPVINVYTDYFINSLWGIECIDYHFAPSKELKKELIRRGVQSNHILVSGIPIHPKFKEQTKVKKEQDVFSVVLSGGNLGTGLIKSFVKTLQPSGKIKYTVLCGKNKKLLNWIQQLGHPLIHAVPYISSKETMNKIYDMADAIITKPGGVTVSECLYKKIPIFIYHELPGQEEINLRNLKKWGLVYHLKSWQGTKNFENTILEILNCEKERERMTQRLKTYHQQLSKDNISVFIERLLVD